MAILCKNYWTDRMANLCKFYANLTHGCLFALTTFMMFSPLAYIHAMATFILLFSYKHVMAKL